MRTFHPLALRIATLIAVLVAMAFAFGGGHLGLGGAPLAEISARHRGALSPAPFSDAAGYATVAALLFFCLASLRPSVRRTVGIDLIATTVLLFALLGTAWLALYRHDRLALALVMMLAMLATAIAMYFVAYELVAEGGSRWWQVPASFAFATTTVSLISDAATLVAAHGQPGRVGQGPWAVAAIVAMSFIAVAVAARFRDFVFPAVIAWAQVGIGAEAEDLRNRVAFAAYLCSGITAVATALVVLVVAAELLVDEVDRLQPRPPGDPHALPAS